MKLIKFEDPTAQKLYNNYIGQAKKATKVLSSIDQEDILMELNSHIYEAIQQKGEEHSEIEVVVNIIDQLGVPTEILKPLIADKKMDQATKTFNPIHIAKALLLNITNGVTYVVFALLYLSLFLGLFLIGAKIMDPQGVGLFFRSGEFLVLGKSPEVLSNPAVEEVLGHWFIPTIALFTIALYFLITLLLKFKNQLKNENHLNF
ncbi:MAG: hypothetical protein ACRBFS_08665 [Aureispira sp.]